MANKLLTRDDIVRAKQNVDAHDKYLDGEAEELVQLPSGKKIKTRAGVEKEIFDKFPASKAGLRDVGNTIGNVVEMTYRGVSLTGMGSDNPLKPPSGAKGLVDCKLNSIYGIDYAVGRQFNDMPNGEEAGLVRCYGHGTRVHLTQFFSSFDRNKVWLRLCRSSTSDGNYDSISDWGEVYHSRNTAPYQTTTATQPNLVVEPNGELRRSTSSRVFKDNIKPLEVENYRESLRMFEPVSYNSKHTSDNPEWVWYSFIAEDLVEIDPSLVQLSPIEFYEDTDEEGNTFVNNRQLPEGEYAPVGLNFNGIITVLTRINQHMLDDIEALEAEKTQLKSRMTKLENRLESLEKQLAAE